MAKADAARRLFLDIDSDGNVILSAPPRTAFDSKGEFPWQHGKSSVEPVPKGFAMASARATLAGFSGSIEIGGRVFFVNIQSVPVDDIARK